jgi:phage baseplate assembly protein W
MTYNKEDIKMDIYHNYEEVTQVVAEDITLTTDTYTLWQAIEGELKTKLGEVDAEAFEGYGSRLHELLGQPMSDLLHKEVEYFVELVMDNYDNIESWDVDTTIEQRPGKLSFILRVVYEGAQSEGVVEIG